MIAEQDCADIDIVSMPGQMPQGIKVKEALPIEMVKVDGVMMPLINARALYRFLGIRSYFYDWIQKRIKQVNFVENKEYFKLIPEKIQIEFRQDYLLTLMMARELSLMERLSFRRNQARLYFIEQQALFDGCISRESC